jgi:flagella basal body P-ring formation protein FlgA
MRVGTHAMLEMDDQRSHVKVSVISLENGNAGDRIRVSSPDRKQVYTAEVIGANLLKRSY